MKGQTAPKVAAFPTAMREAFEQALQQDHGIYTRKDEPALFHAEQRIKGGKVGYVKRSEKWPKARRKKANS